MPTVLVCATPPVESELSHTPFWRDDLERYVADRAEDAVELAVTADPEVVVVDLGLRGAGPLIEALKERARFSALTIVALSHGEADLAAAGEARGVAVLPLPSSPEWDASLVEVLHVPTRRQPRYEVRWGLVGSRPGSPESHGGRALNVSAGGLLAECPGLEAALGDEVAFALSVPGPEPLIEGRARVVRLPRTDLLGLRFESFADDGEPRIRDHVAALAAGIRSGSA